MRAIWPLFLAATFAFSSLAHASPVPNWMRQCVRTFHQGGTCSEGVVSFNNTTNTYGIDVDNDGTDDFTFDATGISVPRVANPCYTFGDSDTTDNDDNAQICVQCTDTGSGTEDCDLTISQQVAGAMTDVYTFDADGVSSSWTRLGQFASINLQVSESDKQLEVGAAGSRGPMVAVGAGVIKGITCALYSGGSAPTVDVITTDSCTGTCYNIELYVNAADTATTDCAMTSGVGTCVVNTLSQALVAGDRYSLAATTAADVTANREIYCTVWGTLD